MIKREDMLELTRRMTVSRTSFTRIAGSYIDDEGYIDGTFNTSFLKLSVADRQKNLLIAKTIPFSETNENLKEYHFPRDKQGNGSIRQLLHAIKASGLKNDALMETFYELVSEQYDTKGEYAIYVFHDRYDVPAKSTDKQRLGESEEVFEYIICAICPLVGAYELGEPECGFIYPLFVERGADVNGIGIYHKDMQRVHKEIVELLV